MRFPLTRRRLDTVGSCLSVACAIHCSLKPLLLVLPSVAWLDFLMGPEFEGAMIALGVMLASGTVAWGYAHHGKPSVVLTLLGAFVLIAAGRFLVPGGLAERMLVVPGGLLVALTHWMNVRLARCCEQSTRGPTQP